jgi:hypothetical protein
VCIYIYIYICAKCTAKDCRTHYVLPHTATRCRALLRTLLLLHTAAHTAAHCRTLPHTAAHCRTLSHCRTLLHTAALMDSHTLPCTLPCTLPYSTKNTVAHCRAHCTHTAVHTAAHCSSHRSHCRVAAHCHTIFSIHINAPKFKLRIQNKEFTFITHINPYNCV